MRLIDADSLKETFELYLENTKPYADEKIGDCPFIHRAYEACLEKIKQEPTVEAITSNYQTILGYRVRDLVILAEALKRQMVSADDVREFVTTLENALKVVQDSYKVTFDEATKMWTGTYEVPGNMAGLYKMMRENNVGDKE